MSEQAQWAPGPMIRPIQMNHGPSGVPRFFGAMSSPEPDMKWEDPEAPDAPLGPDVTDGLDLRMKNEPLEPDVTDESSAPEVKDEPSDSEMTDEPLHPEMADEPLDPEVTDEPLEPHILETTDTHMDGYIPAGVLGKFSSRPRYPDSEIALLEKHEWIRTRSLVDSNNVQVFVLPNAQQKKPIQKRKRGETENILLTHLKLVMSMADNSSEAWSGLVDAHAGLLANTLPDSEEEESLYYIFNTLQEPTLDLDRPTNLHSRDAMEALLGDSVRGLKTQLHPFQRESAVVMVQREAEPALALDPRFQPWRGPTGLEFYYDKESGSILRDKILYPEACGGRCSYLWRWFSK